MKRTASEATPDGAAEASGAGAVWVGVVCACGDCAGTAAGGDTTGRACESEAPLAGRAPDDASERITGGGGSLLGPAGVACERESIGRMSTGVACA